MARRISRFAGVATLSTLLWVNGPLPFAVAADDPVTLNFKDADIDSVVGAFGHLLNRTFLIDPRVRGKITLETPRPVSRAQAYDMLQASLRMQGFAVVDNGELTKVVPEADAKLQSGPVGSTQRLGGALGVRGDQVVTQIFRLQYESASNLVPVLRPLITPNNTVTAYPNNNSLVITDYAANVQRLGRIIASLDAPSNNEVEVIPMRYTVASDVATTVARMLDDTARGTGAAVPTDPGQRVTILSDARTNAVMVRATSPAKMSLARSLIQRLDQPSATPGNIHVVYLRNAEALKLAQVLKGVLSGEAGAYGSQGGFGSQNATGMTTNTPGTAFGQQANANGSAFGSSSGLGNSRTSTLGNQPLNNSQSTSQPTAVVAGGAVIAADPATNSLIITAPEPLYMNLRSVIDRLDVRRAQIYIEALIVEVDANKASEMGIQWQFLDPGSGSSKVIGGTNLGTAGSGTNIFDGLTNPTAYGNGLNLGLVKGTVTINGTQILNLGLLARALENNSSTNILATPTLLTLDNEEARIIIGQNVPFITGQYATTATATGTVNPFQTVERQDVGTTLRVKPQVSESGTVKLQIYQEVSSVQDTSLAAGLITNRRAIESNVLVDDGQLVVLGGLIQDEVDGSVQSVPILGSLPLIGQLFRYDTRSHKKTNLLIFLRPRILRDARDAYNVTADRYDYITHQQDGAQLPQHWALPQYTSPSMDGMTAPPAPAPATRRNAEPPPGIQVVPQGQAPAPSAVPGASQTPSQTPSTPSSMPQSSTGQPGAAVPSAAVSQQPAPISRSSPTMIQTAPNEVLIPMNREVRIVPLNSPEAPSSPNGAPSSPAVLPSGTPGARSRGTPTYDVPGERGPQGG